MLNTDPAGNVGGVIQHEPLAPESATQQQAGQVQQAQEAGHGPLAPERAVVRAQWRRKSHEVTGERVCAGAEAGLAGPGADLAWIR